MSQDPERRRPRKLVLDRIACSGFRKPSELKARGEEYPIGSVVAEFVAGAGGRASGLAYRILEAGYRLDVPRMFAALFLISLTGIAIYLSLSALTYSILRQWHESVIGRE